MPAVPMTTLSLDGTGQSPFVSGSRRQEQGEGKIRLLVTLLVTVAIIVVAIRIVPVYVDSFEFKDAIRHEAKYASIQHKEPDEVRRVLYRKAQELGLPVDRKEIRVSRMRSGLRISVKYTVPVDLTVHTIHLSFSYEADTFSVN